MPNDPENEPAFPDHIAMTVLHRYMHWYLFARDGKPHVIKRYKSRRTVKGNKVVSWEHEEGGLDGRHLTAAARVEMTKAWDEYAEHQEAHKPPPPTVELRTERQGILAEAVRTEGFDVSKDTLKEWEILCRRAGIRDYDEAAAFVAWATALARRNHMPTTRANDLRELAPQWQYHKPRPFRAGA